MVLSPSDHVDLVVALDGELCRDARISVWDHGLLYGDGCYEGMRLRDGLLFRAREHLARLRRSARALDIDVPSADEEILDQVAAVAGANGIVDAHVRIVLTRGRGAPGLDPRRSERPSLIVMAYPFPPLLGADPLRLIVSSIARKAPRSVDAQVKSLNYLDAILAKQQANAAAADDAIMLDGDGTVAEATSANVFVVRDGIVATPTTRAALPGITRRSVLELLVEEGVDPAVRDVTWGELYVGDEAFLTGSGVGIVPIGAVDGRSLAAAPGPVTRLVQEAYARRVADPAWCADLRTRIAEPSR
jgi:branched-chain amino acid aminotransferase